MLEEVITKISGAFVDTLPVHNGALFIEHNPFKLAGQSLKNYVEAKGGEEMWVNTVEMQKAIATNEMWSLTWYPQGPMGYCTIFASTLPAVMVAMYESEVLRHADEQEEAKKQIILPGLTDQPKKGKLIL